MSIAGQQIDGSTQNRSGIVSPDAECMRIRVITAMNDGTTVRVAAAGSPFCGGSRQINNLLVL